MDLHRYVRAIRKGWWLIVAGALIGAALGYGYSARQAPVYASHLTFYVASPALNSADANATNQFAQDRATSYAGLVSSDALAKRVVASTPGLGLSEREVAKEISGSAQLNTILIDVTIRDTSSRRALAIATAVGDQFPELVSDLDNTSAQSGKANAAVNLTVVSGPQVSKAPVAPRTKLNVGLGLALGLLLGLAVAVVRDLLDMSVRSAEVLAEVSGVPTLGSIAYDPAIRLRPLVLGELAYSPRAEAVRQLRTNLQFIDAAKPARTVVVTSSREGEGKSTTSVNLALVVAETGRRVLLVEADLRKPRVSQLLGVGSAVGLSNVLAGQRTVEEVTQKWGTGNLSVLPCGPIPPNPSELLDGERMKALLEECSARYDLVIFDSPPLRPVTDAAVIAAQADGAIVVFWHGHTKRGQLHAAVEALHSVHARVLGCVLNMKPLSRSERRGYAAYAPEIEARTHERSSGDGAGPAAEDSVDDGDGSAECDPAEGSSTTDNPANDDPEQGAATESAKQPSTSESATAANGTAEGGASPDGDGVSDEIPSGKPDPSVNDSRVTGSQVNGRPVKIAHGRTDSDARNRARRKQSYARQPRRGS